jgi:short-subunit dehydrogenase
MAKPFAIVTGASSGIGYELAARCAREGFDLLVAADSPDITSAAEVFRGLGAAVQAVPVDLATMGGVERLYAACEGRAVDACSPTPGTAWAKRFSTRSSPTSCT